MSERFRYVSGLSAVQIHVTLLYSGVWSACKYGRMERIRNGQMD